MPYPYQNILLCRWSPGCDVHYDAKPALSIPSKLSVPRIHPYWFVLVRTGSYWHLPYCIIPYHTYIHTYSSRDRIQPQLFWFHTDSVHPLYSILLPLSLFPLGAPSLLPSLPSLYYLIVGGPWKGWCTISSISVFKLIFWSFFLHIRSTSYELMRATNWLE